MLHKARKKAKLSTTAIAYTFEEVDYKHFAFLSLWLA